MRNVIEEARRLILIKEQFPDLEEQKLRFKTVLVSKTVNDNPESVSCKRSCGCCPDAIYYACFYVESHGVRVYGNPPELSIGEYVSYYGEDDDEEHYRLELYDNYQDIIRKYYGDKGINLFREHNKGI